MKLSTILPAQTSYTISLTHTHTRHIEYKLVLDVDDSDRAVLSRNKSASIIQKNFLDGDILGSDSVRGGVVGICETKV